MSDLCHTGHNFAISYHGDSNYTDTKYAYGITQMVEHSALCKLSYINVVVAVAVVVVVTSNSANPFMKPQTISIVVQFSVVPGVKSLPVSALNELLEELEVTIRDHSEVLIAELALRDELEYEKVTACLIRITVKPVLTLKVLNF